MELRIISPENQAGILSLQVGPEQTGFVASNRESLEDAARAKKRGLAVLPLGLYERQQPVGFAMLGWRDTGDDQLPACASDSYCLWRFMVDARYQGRGLGREGLQAVLRLIRTYPLGPARWCWVSYEPDNLAARCLYRQAGFRETGEETEGETVAVLPVSDIPVQHWRINQPGAYRKQKKEEIQ